MGSYKVEVNAYEMWLPATHKYFKDRQKAMRFMENLVKKKLEGNKKAARIRQVGRHDFGEAFFTGFAFTLLVACMLFWIVIITM